MYELERVELELPAKVIDSIQTSLQVLKNANTHNTGAHRKTPLVQMNARLKEIVRSGDFKDTAHMLFGEGFWSLARNRKQLQLPNLVQTLQEPLLKEARITGVTASIADYRQTGWQPSNRKTAQKQSSMK